MSDWQRVKSIFEELIELPVDDREELLDRLCGDDSDTRAAVARLLASHDHAGEFMGAPTLDHGGGSPLGAGMALPARINAYTPIEVIGEGGFGTVYRARQETPVRRIVALKVIKPGMDTREVIARFESERQALAMMSHPNIAAVHDAGATEEGRPYFVMEFVSGEPIATFCDRHRLPLRERLGLFIQVCHAVQHAHQKGVIHRDIKPSNVLVVHQDVHTPTHVGSTDDGSGNGGSGSVHLGSQTPVAKVIDFGVAKATDQRLTEHTLYTQAGMLVGTPEYMSPEQADPTQLDIDTRTDIYSLGVLLYELVTGTLPFSSKTLRGMGFAEIQRTVREVDPPRPSTRLSTLMRVGSGEREAASKNQTAQTNEEPKRSRPKSAEEIALSRGTDPRSLIKHVRGDLDWIIMKCMEKDRARRYETANSVALEAERYLKNEPVVAGPPGAGYRLRKFARRNRAALIAISVTCTAVLVGLTVSIVGFAAAVRSRDEADKQRFIAQKNAEDAVRAARTSEAVNQFLKEMLSEADPRKSAKREITVREALDLAVERLDAGKLKDQPEIESAVRLTIGRSYAGLARFAGAEAQLELAIAGFRDTLGPNSSEYAEALQHRGGVRKLTGRSAEAEFDLRAARAIHQALGETAAMSAAGCTNDLALTLLDQGRFDEAEPLLREVLTFARRPNLTNESILGEAVNNMGSLHLAREDFAKAEPLFREAVEVNRRVLGEVHPNIATNLDNLAQTLHGKGDLNGAEGAYLEALAIRRELFGAEHPDVATSLHNLAVLHFVRGDVEACEKELRESLAIFRATHGPAHSDTLTVVFSLISVVGGRGNLAEAERLLLEFFEIIRDDSEVDAELKHTFASRLVQLYQAWGKPEKAAEWSRVAETLKPPAPATQPRASDPAEPPAGSAAPSN